jgi:pimeloyl-ACP methyl ester carboxylesterase
MDFAFVVIPALVLLVAILVTWLALRRIFSPSLRNCRMWRRVTERILLSLVILVAVPVATISTYNAVALQIFRLTNPPLGKLYFVNGHKMHLYCLGNGDPTIILEPGLGPATDVLSWSDLQPKLAKTTRVCSYDRAGLGWSEPQSGPSDADHIAANLHELLAQAKVNGPLVLLGTSYGGIYIRDYTAHNPADVAGLVFVDSSTPYQEQRFQALAGPSKPVSPAIHMTMGGALYLLGGVRLLGWCRPVPGREEHAGKALGEDRCMPRYESLKEFQTAAQSSQQTVHSGPFGALPILIFSQDPSKILSLQNPHKEWIEQAKLWDAMQEDLKSLSTRSRRIIAKGSGHGVTEERQDLVLREVSLFLEQIRQAAPQPTNYGSTTVE